MMVIMWYVRLQVTCSLVSTFHRTPQTDCMSHADWQRLYWTVCFTALSSSGVFVHIGGGGGVCWGIITTIPEFCVRTTLTHSPICRKNKQNCQHISTNCTGVLEVYASQAFLFIYFYTWQIRGWQEEGWHQFISVMTHGHQSFILHLLHDSDCDCWGHLCEHVIL